ncbi:MAG: hypothetical protein AB7T06_29245 [Kofleriaceae bacterium]
MAVRRLILKGIGGAGARPQAVAELAVPASLSGADLERALRAAIASLGARVRVRGEEPAPAVDTEAPVSAQGDVIDDA